MREIKFRAWDKKRKKMHPYFLVYSHGERDLCRLSDEFNDYIWLQYTGLKDKNGDEIYEGDIIRVWLYDYNHETPEWELLQVRYSGGHWEAHCNLNITGNPMTEWLEELDCEIVGNIYENPELLGA